MYCPHCGGESTFGLKYCKRCGGNLAAQTSPQGPSTMRQTGAAWAVAFATVAICLGGLGIVFSAASELMEPRVFGQPQTHDVTPIVITMIVFGSLTVFGVVAMLIRLFSRLMIAPKETMLPAQFERPVAGGYAQLQEPVMPSVTENTTRNFEQPRYREPLARE